MSVIKRESKSPLKLGKELPVFNSSPTAAGTEEYRFIVEADTVLFSVQASVVSGTLKVEVFTEGTDGAEVRTIEFPELSAPTTDLLLRKASATMQKVVVRATYSGACTFVVRARGTATGEASFRILGANDLVVSKTSVSTTAGAVVTAALTDRATVVIKNNNSTTGVLYIAETLAKATTDAYPVGPQESFVVDIQAGQEIFGVADAGTIDVRIAETGGQPVAGIQVTGPAAPSTVSIQSKTAFVVTGATIGTSETTIAIPAGAKALKLQIAPTAGAATLTVSHVLAGTAATATSFDICPGDRWQEEFLDGSGFTIYIRSSKAATDIQVMYWT